MSRHTPSRTDTPPPSSPTSTSRSKPTSPKKGKGNTATAHTQFRLTSPYGVAFDTILYRIEINHDGRHATKEQGQAALTRMAQYCRTHGADPQLRRRETYAASQEEQVLYVRVRTDPSVWGRLRHQAQRLGLLPHLVKETNEIPPDAEGLPGKSDPMAAIVRSLLQTKEGRST